ncbi:unnamed protein product (macronuclear) [Paramecium tetraurelia]|uniref:H(+)-exporting diphosphatase n=1 Tax=Paramecium tetraurelia TaxID=5888 RepID=A0CIW2_PARTE|nr:uncharacterized protein GSPATT00007864001 [Paramecium tetraurelia]CAK70729.1 unnamed protein product [Paramecium tetraurelia]|eukprot:XP_001438126.1 hypothetical protein (macronuclear) [Paramecium tetraurelia strain d4-2]
MSAGIFIGTIIFIGIGIGVTVWLKGVVTKATKNLSDLNDNLLQCNNHKSRLMYVSVISGTIQFWLLWFCMYMHQLNPIISPIRGHE